VDGADLMATTRAPIDPPPDPATKVDDEKGVNFIWHNWFTRLYAYVLELAKRIAALEIVPAVVATSGMVPYFIAATETFTVPVYKQALFEMTIDSQGLLVVDGFLIQVS
jgi:hypothetical protein